MAWTLVCVLSGCGHGKGLSELLENKQDELTGGVTSFPSCLIQFQVHRCVYHMTHDIKQGHSYATQSPSQKCFLHFPAVPARWRHTCVRSTSAARHAPGRCPRRSAAPAAQELWAGRLHRWAERVQGATEADRRTWNVRNCMQFTYS